MDSSWVHSLNKSFLITYCVQGTAVILGKRWSSRSSLPHSFLHSLFMAFTVQMGQALR
jgi:hypothetical protein